MILAAPEGRRKTRSGPEEVKLKTPDNIEAKRGQSVSPEERRETFVLHQRRRSALSKQTFLRTVLPILSRGFLLGVLRGGLRGMEGRRGRKNREKEGGERLRNGLIKERTEGEGNRRE